MTICAFVVFTQKSSVVWAVPFLFYSKETKSIMLNETASPIGMLRRYCKWNQTLHQDCKILSAIKGNYQHWTFLGDSTMMLTARLANFSSKYEREPMHVARGRCSQLKHLGFSALQSNDWVKPNATMGEGPAMYGLEHPSCKDCSGCNSYRLGLNQTLEYLAVEFARDVEMQTSMTKTTQETTALYLSRLGDYGTACVVNSGVHDLAIQPKIGMHVYVANVKEYLTLLQPVCDALIWLGTSSCLENPRHPQRNVDIVQWNHGVYNMLAREMPEVYVIDLYEKSNRTEHKDNIHLQHYFYKELGDFFLSLM